MVLKPTEKEEEYFARMEFERIIGSKDTSGICYNLQTVIPFRV